MNGHISRGMAVWLAITTAAATVAWWLLAAQLPSADSFDGLLANGAAVLLAGCAVWAWLVTTIVLVAEVLGGRRTPGVPVWARRTVLAACGLALVGISPAHASPVLTPPAPSDPGAEALIGLQLPDRTTGPAHRRQLEPGGFSTPVWSADRATNPSVRVRPGDSLWRIASRLLVDGACATEVAELTDLLYTLNRAVIGDDPDLITPDQLLRTPHGVRTDR